MNALSIKSLSFVFYALLLIAGSAVAQQDRNRGHERDQHRGPPDAEMRVAKMTSMLGLSDEQSAQLLVVMQSVDAEREALHQRVMEQMEPELCDLQLRTEADIASILTDDQLATMEEKKLQRQQRGGKDRRRGMENLDCSAYE